MTNRNELFEFDNYRTFLKDLIGREERGIVKRLSSAAGCQRSYLSQCLTGHVNLTPDHLFGICAFLNLDELQTEYLMLLLEKERAGNKRYRKHLESKASGLTRKHQRLTKRIKAEDKNRELNHKYYSAWYYSALHIATSIDRLKSDRDYSVFLSLDVNLVSQVLRELQGWGLVAFEDNVWSFAGMYNIHLDDESPMSRMNHLNWRTKALSSSLDAEKSLHYTSVFTASKTDVGRMKAEILELIARQRSTISASGSEELVNFCCDFYHVSEGVTP